MTTYLQFFTIIGATAAVQIFIIWAAFRVGRRAGYTEGYMQFCERENEREDESSAPYFPNLPFPRGKKLCEFTFAEPVVIKGGETLILSYKLPDELPDEKEEGVKDAKPAKNPDDFTDDVVDSLYG